ncbi:hypothetical protein [Sediminibacterium sp.]|uniref:hypothetical protein n=1 Tax=Sediminibacterium sp. TaxID=1917865 RepID=UPI002732649E|nr:hypothetical protein [Sediminibacterium sp.]MDP3394254.1 hypothetical protein [Sediminibacterium sp.]MDP3567056.1 hypothetical protein [Sediminibacterium sp.]
MRILWVVVYISFILVGCKKTNDIIVRPVPTPAPVIKLPILVTDSIKNLSGYSVDFSGRLVDSGGSKVKELGFLVDTVSMPTLQRNVNKITKNADSAGVFKSVIIGIPSNKRWYIRTYGINDDGVGYGNEVSFNSLPDKTYFGSITLSNQQEVNDFGSNNYTYIRGGLTVTGTTITDLSPLNSIIKISSRLDIIRTSIKDFTGLENLEIIGVDFPGGLKVEHNYLLKNFKGLKKLKIIDGNTSIFRNKILENLEGLESLTTCLNFEIHINDNENLKSLKGLEQLRILLGSLMIRRNPLLTDISALRNLEVLYYDLEIDNNASLTNLNGLEKIKLLERISLKNNPNLLDISALRNIDSVRFAIYAIGNSVLSDFTPLNKIKHLEILNVSDNSKLSSLDAFQNLRSLIYLYVERNPLLFNFKGMENIQSLKILYVSHNDKLLNMKGLDNLSNVETVNLNNNPSLKNLEGLGNIKSLKTLFAIAINSSLDDYCAVKPLLVSGITGEWLVTDNKFNPTISQVIANCK